MKKKKIGIAIILLVVLFSGLFLWWWTKPIKITTNKIVKVTIKGYDAEVVSSNKQCIQEAIQLVENTRAIPLGDWAVKYIGGDSPDLMVMFRMIRMMQLHQFRIMEILLWMKIVIIICLTQKTA